ncbi:hypothetical protein ABZ208_37970 [Streptomyces sp. NPDC006208]|uniref:hypothetical protein n=1 Tax=Streptomyces sp. NPDC006208 TaxID=3156734 RepID=UPI0033B98540
MGRGLRGRGVCPGPPRRPEGCRGPGLAPGTASPPSPVEADQHTPGSTAGAPHQTPQVRSAGRTDLTAGVQENPLICVVSAFRCPPAVRRPEVRLVHCCPKPGDPVRAAVDNRDRTGAVITTGRDAGHSLAAARGVADAVLLDVSRHEPSDRRGSGRPRRCVRRTPAVLLHRGTPQ